LNAGLQASHVQEIDEEVKRYMVAVLIPLNLPWSSLCAICRRREKWHGLLVNAGYMHGLGADFHWFDDRHCSQN